MKTPDSLEEMLRSWTPRAPAARIEEELFGTTCRRPEPRPHVVLPWWRSFGASAVAFAVAMFTVLNVVQLTTTNGAPNGAFISFSNYSSAASLAMASAPVNTWSAPILGWTNEGASGSIPRSLKVLTTNQILH